MFFWGLAVGIFIGTIFGVVLMCLLYYSRYGDERSDNGDQPNRQKPKQ